MRILWAAVSGSVLILLVLLFRGIFRKKVPKRAVVLLWLLVCVRLLVPMNVSGLVSLSLPARLAQYVNEAEESFQEDRAENRGNAANSENAANLEIAEKPEITGESNGGPEAAAVHQEEADISIPAYILPAENAENPAEGKTAAGNENYNTAENVSPGNAAEINAAAENVSSGKTAERNEENGNSAEGLLRLLYPAGAVLTALAFLILYGIGFLRLRKSEAVPEELVLAWKRSHPLRRSLRFRMLSGIESPLTYGIIRPVIVIPAGGFFDRDGWQYALEHEYRHIRNFDFLIKLIAAAAVCMHFWNPLVWLMYFMLNRDIEYACDEMVIGTLGEAEKGAYGRALLMMEEQRYSLTFLHAGFGKHPVRLRIEKLVKYRKASAAGIVLSVLLALILVSCGTFGVKDPTQESTPEVISAAESIKDSDSEKIETQDSASDEGKLSGSEPGQSEADGSESGQSASAQNQSDESEPASSTPRTDTESAEWIADSGMNWMEAAAVYADRMEEGIWIPDSDPDTGATATWKKGTARAYDLQRGPVSDFDETAEEGLFELLLFYTTDQPDKVSFTDAPYSALLDNWNSTEHHLQEGVLPGIFEDPEVPKDAYVNRRYCRIRKESGLWHVYFIGTSPVDKETAEAAENEHAEVLLRQPFFGTYVRVLPDGAGYDCYDTMSISSYSLSSHRKSLFNEAVRENNGDLLFSYTLEDVTYQTMRVHPDTSEDGRVMTITVTEFRDGSPSEILQYERNDFYEKNITGVYVSASDPKKDLLIVDEYGRVKYRGSMFYVVGKNTKDGGIRLFFCDENGRPSGTEAVYVWYGDGPSSILVTENGKSEGYFQIESGKETPLPEMHRAFLEADEMYISRSEGALAGQPLSCKNCANFTGYLQGATGAYYEVDYPEEITGSVISYWGADPEIRVSLLEDYDLILYENHGEKHACVNVSYTLPDHFSYSGTGIRSLYDEAEFYTLLGFAPGEEIVIPDRGQDALSAAEEYCELYEKTVASVSPGSKCALAFCDVTVRAWDRNTGEAAESVDESADSCDLLYEYLWACDTEESYRWHIPGGTFAYLGDRTDVPGNTWHNGIFAVIKREADGWHLDLRGGTF